MIALCCRELAPAGLQPDCASSATSQQCEEQDSNLHALRTLEPKRRQGPLQTPSLLGKDASADVLRGSEKTHSGQDVPEASDVVTMSQVRAFARALVRRVAEGGEIPLASLRELGDLVLRSELFARRGTPTVPPGSSPEEHRRCASA